MLNLCELNGYLYQHLDREAKKKEMVRNYGSYLMHSEDNSAKPNIAEQANSWLAHFAEMINDDKSELNKSAESAKAVAEVMIPECSKILRKVNAQKAGKELAKKLVDARKSLEDIYQAAMAHSAMEQQEHMEHGEKWKKHKYIDISPTGRYIYPEDTRRKKEGKVVLMPQDKIRETAKTDRQVKSWKEQHDKEVGSLMNAKNQKETNQAVATIRQNDAAKKLMSSVVKQEAENKAAKEAKQKEEFNKNAAAGQHEGDRYSKENIQKQQEANTKAANEYQNEKQKAVGGTTDNSISAQDKAKKDASFKQQMEPIVNELVRQYDRLNNKEHPNGSITTEDWRAKHKKAEQELARIWQEVYGNDTWPDYGPGQELQQLFDKARKKSMEHSAFSISDDEMSAFLAKRGKSITT